MRTGRLFVLGFDGTSVPEWLLDFARRFGLGGIILFRKNCPDAESVRALLRETKTRLGEVDPGWAHAAFVDQEGGRVERLLDGVPRLPAARVQGRGGPTAVEEAARDQAGALLKVGFDVNLAPVCDVLQEGESGDISDRSFGDEPEDVARLAAAFARGTMAGGLCPCAKHFPGLGAAPVNSHKGLPTVAKSLAELERVELGPFRALLAEQVPLVMAAHCVFPAVSPSPASLSPEWLEGVLREGLGYGGAVISDDMEMGALDGLAPPPEAAERAVRAGCDLLIYGRMLRPELDLFPIAEALEARLPPERVAGAQARVSAAFAKVRFRP